MGFSSPSINEFKDYFDRDFPFTPVQATQLVDSDPVTPQLPEVPLTDLIPAVEPPPPPEDIEVIDEFKYVRDKDIQRAITDTKENINRALFTKQSQFTASFLNLTAHYLIMNLRASSQGVDGEFDWLLTNKGVGSVSAGFHIPTYLADNPVYSFYCKTPYGVRYIVSVYGMTKGQIFTVAGATLP